MNNTVIRKGENTTTLDAQLLLLTSNLNFVERVTVDPKWIDALDPTIITLENAWVVCVHASRMFPASDKPHYLYRTDVLNLTPASCSGTDIIAEILSCVRI